MKSNSILGLKFDSCTSAIASFADTSALYSLIESTIYIRGNVISCIPLFATKEYKWSTIEYYPSDLTLKIQFDPLLVEKERLMRYFQSNCRGQVTPKYVETNHFFEMPSVELRMADPNDFKGFNLSFGVNLWESVEKEKAFLDITDEAKVRDLRGHILKSLHDLYYRNLEKQLLEHNREEVE